MKDTLTIPGAIDIHVHLREPSSNKAETIASGTKAALFGGVVAVCDMPNNPGAPIWTAQALAKKHAIINRGAYVPVATYAGAQPESDNLAELPAMAATSIGLKLYGAPTTGNQKNYDAADFAEIVSTWHAATTKPIMLHSGPDNLQDFINLIAKKHSHRLHVCHLFSVEHAKLVMQAKKRGLPVTGGVCPHHLVKTSHQASTEGWFARMQPPLMHQDEAEELFKLFAKGDIDILETDHAPHTLSDKWAAEADNSEGNHDASARTCFGVPGIEFALPLMFYQMKRGKIKLDRIVEATSTKPAQIIGVKLSPKTKVTWQMNEYRIGHDHPKGLSGSGWTPYLNNLAVGKVQKVVIGGQIVFHTGTAKRAGRVLQAGETI